MIPASEAENDDGDDDAVYSPADVAVLLNRSVRHVLELIRDGKLEAFRVPDRYEQWVTRRALHEYLNLSRG